MILCVWRVSGTRFDVDTFLAAHPQLQPDRVWHRGERGLLGEQWDSSGFNETIGEARTAHELVGLLSERAFENLVRVARSSSGESELDFGVAVSVNKPGAGVQLTPEGLRYCADVGVTIVVSAYAAADA